MASNGMHNGTGMEASDGVFDRNPPNQCPIVASQLGSLNGANRQWPQLRISMQIPRSS